MLKSQGGASAVRYRERLEKHRGEYQPAAPRHDWSGGAPPPWSRRQDGKTPEGAARVVKIRLESYRLPPQ